MTTSERHNTGVVLGTTLWLRDEDRFSWIDGIDHTPQPGEEFVIDGERWRVVAWTNRIECELLTN